MALFVVMALASIGYMVSTARLLGRLQSHHPRTYEALGKPGVYVANNYFEWIQVIPFIWRRDYLVIRDDPLLARWGAYARAALLVLAGGFVMFWVVLAATDHLTAGS
jgi:hypothetical protein